MTEKELSEWGGQLMLSIGPCREHRLLSPYFEHLGCPYILTLSLTGHPSAHNFYLQKGETKFAPPTIIIHQGSSCLFGLLANK